MGNDILELVSNAFTKGNINLTFVAILIVPIRKDDNPRNLKEFRLISLCNVLFMLVSKVLVNWIQPHLDVIVGPLQSFLYQNGVHVIMLLLPKRLSTICTRR